MKDAVKIFTGKGFETALLITLDDGLVVYSCSVRTMERMLVDVEEEEKPELLAQLGLAQEAEDFIHAQQEAERIKQKKEAAENAVQLLEAGKMAKFEGYSFQWEKAFGCFEGTNPYGQPCFGGTNARGLVDRLAAGETFGQTPDCI